MKTQHIALLSLLCLLTPTIAHAKDKPHRPWRLDAGLTFSHFEQQIKVEIGGVRGEKLVTDSELGLNVFATYSPWSFLGLGLFAQADFGQREAGRFSGVDANNQTITTGELGGPYREFWIGPLVRGQWKTLFAEVGYGFGVRDDQGRTDLPSTSGDTTSALYTSASVAWLFAIGAGVPITETLQAVLRIEYRIRYYDQRGDEAFKDNLVHGTQNLLPFFGLGWTF